jgi:hypothetical protein
MIRDRIVVGIKDANLSDKMQLDPDLTLKKATDMARQYFTPFAGQLSLERFWRCPHLRHPAPFCWLKGFFGLGIDCLSL